MKKEKSYQDTHKINIQIIFQSPILRRCLEIIKEVTALQIQRSTDVISAWTISTRYISKDNTRNSYVQFNTFPKDQSVVSKSSTTLHNNSFMRSNTQWTNGIKTVVSIDFQLLFQTDTISCKMAPPATLIKNIQIYFEIIG